MTGSTKKKNAVHRMCIEGEMSIYRAEELKSLLLQSLIQYLEIEIDLSAVSEIDSSGLQIMVAAKKMASNESKTMRFVNHSPAVLDMLDRSNLGGYFGDPVVITSPAHQ
jgi:anti-sigma B factor antagonist